MYGINRYKKGYVVMYNKYQLSINDLPMDRTVTSYDDEYRYTHETDQFGCRTFTVYGTAKEAQCHADALNEKEQELLAKERETLLERNKSLSSVIKPVVVGVFIGTLFGIALGLLV